MRTLHKTCPSAVGSPFMATICQVRINAHPTKPLPVCRRVAIYGDRLPGAHKCAPYKTSAVCRKTLPIQIQQKPTSLLLTKL